MTVISQILQCLRTPSGSAPSWPPASSTATTSPRHPPSATSRPPARSASASPASPPSPPSWSASTRMSIYLLFEQWWELNWNWLELNENLIGIKIWNSLLRYKIYLNQIWIVIELKIVQTVNISPSWPPAARSPSSAASPSAHLLVVVHLSDTTTTPARPGGCLTGRSTSPAHNSTLHSGDLCCPPH